MIHAVGTFAFISALALTIAPATAVAQADTTQLKIGTSWEFSSAGMKLRASVVANDFRAPSGMVFLPDGRILATSRGRGQLVLVDTATGAKTVVSGLPEVSTGADGGTLDVALHPRYRENGWIYVIYTIDVPGGSMPVIDRAKLDGSAFIDRARIYEARPLVENSEHYGARLLFHQGYLFVSIGDHNARDFAQYFGDPYGKIIRLRDDGTPAAGNPFAGRQDTRSEIWTLGHRNPQGLAINPLTGSLWEHEHGPQGGDEINIIRRGRNYGWPLVSFGGEYAGGPIGKGETSRPGFAAPLRHFTPALAPSGMMFYTGDKFPAWRNNLFVGALAARALVRFTVSGDNIQDEERLLLDRRWRVRNVVQGPNGLIYLGVDGGSLIRISPSTE